MIIVAANTKLQIFQTLVTRPISRSPRTIPQFVGEVVDVALDAVADAKMTAISGSRAMIIRMGIEMITEMVLKIGEMLGCAITVVKSVDGIIPTRLDFILLGSVILTLFTCQPTTPIGICQVRLLVLQLSLEPLREAEQAPWNNIILIFLK